MNHDREVLNVLEEGGKNGVDRSRCNNQRRNWNIYNRSRLGSRRFDANRCRGRACVGSLTVCGEVLYREVGNRRKGPPCAVADEGVVERVFPVVKRVEVRTRLLIAGEEEVFGFSPSEVRWIV